MMKTKIILITIMLLITGGWSLVAQNNLTITVDNISPAEGKLFVAVYNSPETYMSIEKAAFREIVPVEKELQSVIIKDVPEGEYAIAIFQDLNGNEKLDTRGMGIPKEPFGFSNDARSKTGPPKFKNAKFSFPAENDIHITLVNNAKK
jgi:uncharacterized protein (DUF2141 family)